MAHDLASLITVLDGMLHPTDQNDHKKPLLESFLEKASSLKNLFEESVKHGHLRRSRYKGILLALQSEIRDAAHEAEDIIEPHAVDQMLSEPRTSRFLSSPPDHHMLQVMEKFDAAYDKLMKIIKDDQSREEEAVEPTINPYWSVAKPNIVAMVGFEEDALHLKHRLTSRQRSGREIIPIVGMGGIGKTTLARRLYDDPLIVSHFDVRAWVTVSQEYNVRDILLGLLGSNSGNDSDSTLGDTLHRRLYGRRYLLVLDDIWSEKAWDGIKRYFPNQNHGSRILITSRELDVAKYPDPACEVHQMRLLSSAQGWDLLRQKVFDAKKEERCPPFLEGVGQKIVSGCRGLPLAISAIGGILSVDKYSKDLWEKVAEDVRSVLSDRDEDFSKILCLSYDNLPLHLKPCFLYMAAFPEDFEVKGSKLVKLWVAEGFLWSSSGNNKSMEDVAEEHLKALVDRNLLYVTRAKSNGRPEFYSMHDLLRDLCVRKADEEKFLRVVNDGEAPPFDSSRRVSLLSFDIKDATALSGHYLLSRSLLFIGRELVAGNTFPMICNLRLVKVLDVYNLSFNQFPIEILQLVNLRFLATTISPYGYVIPSEISRLRNLQTLLVRHRVRGNPRLSPDVWKISSLRHFKLTGSLIYFDQIEFSRVHEKLQTIYYIYLATLLVVINSIPNVKKLGISAAEYIFGDVIVDLSHLHKLETLMLHSFVEAPVLSQLKLPNCLKKISLTYCFTIPMRLMNVLGALQYLEVFKIACCGFQLEEHGDARAEEWELNEGVEFCFLRFLELHGLSIVRWKADSSHFPSIRHLKILECYALEEVPTSFGEISMLEMIELGYDCGSSLKNSAIEIQKTQHEYGNEACCFRIVNG